MKVAIIGSRSLVVGDLYKYISDECDEIVSGGAKGIDKCAEDFAYKHNLKLTVILPQYSCYGKAAPLIRNRKIVDYADEVVAFWDRLSKGTKNVIDYCSKTGKKCTVIYIDNQTK
jgi:hypothetical protein